MLSLLAFYSSPRVGTSTFFHLPVLFLFSSIKKLRGSLAPITSLHLFNEVSPPNDEFHLGPLLPQQETSLSSVFVISSTFDIFCRQPDLSKVIRLSSPSRSCLASFRSTFVFVCNNEDMILRARAALQSRLFIPGNPRFGLVQASFT